MHFATTIENSEVVLLGLNQPIEKCLLDYVNQRLTLILQIDSRGKDMVNMVKDLECMVCAVTTDVQVFETESCSSR